MTQKEQLIYNKFLAVTRSRSNRPFKLRKNFEGFTSDPQYAYIRRLDAFFSKHPNINIDDFFAAPYDLYEEPGEVYLSYYITRAAIRAYSLAQKKREDASPEKMHEQIRDSLRFIGMFCIKNNMQVADYIFHKTGCTLSWMQHYRQRSVNIYSLLEFNKLSESISSVPQDERELFLGETQNYIATYKSRYYNSTSTVNLVREGMKKISTFVENSLNNNKPKN